MVVFNHDKRPEAVSGGKRHIMSNHITHFRRSMTSPPDRHQIDTRYRKGFPLTKPANSCQNGDAIFWQLVSADSKKKFLYDYKEITL